ncbi:MAG: hypothetical protein N2485_08565, partial [bacterium]|nr:hypothetical protein [bacterium]
IEELTNNIAKLQSNVDKFINDNQEQINVLSDSIKKINNNINDESSIKINSLNDSVIKLENKINELTSNNAMGLKILEERLNRQP